MGFPLYRDIPPKRSEVRRKTWFSSVSLPGRGLPRSGVAGDLGEIRVVDAEEAHRRGETLLRG